VLLSKALAFSCLSRILKNKVYIRSRRRRVGRGNGAIRPSQNKLRNNNRTRDPSGRRLKTNPLTAEISVIYRLCPVKLKHVGLGL
jgi:hypothetical protein